MLQNVQSINQQMAARPSGDNDPFFRIIADGDTIFRVDRTGVTNFGGIGVELEDLTITGTLTMGQSGVITNAGNDFIIDEDGYGVRNNPSLVKERSYQIRDNNNNAIGALWGTSANIVLQGISGRNVTLFTESNGIIRFTVSGSGHHEFIGVPSSPPAASFALWRDSNGFLRLT